MLNYKVNLIMDKVLIGFDFSMNKPAATIYYKGEYYHYFWPLKLTAKQQKQYEDADVMIRNRMMSSVDTKSIENSQLVLIHTIRSTDLANLIINDIDEFINDKMQLTDYDLYVSSEGLSYASKGDATLNLATYKGVLLSKIYEHYGDHLKRLYTYSPITLKATAGCSDKESRADKTKMISKYIQQNTNIKLRLCLANGYMKSKTNYIPGIDDLVDSYWALITMMKKEKI